MALYIKETFVNADMNYIIGESEWFEAFTDNLGRLFRSCQKQYGKCISRIYQDTPDGTADPIGWVFQKHVKYRDCNEYYIQETWVHARYQIDNYAKKYEGRML